MSQQYPAIKEIKNLGQGVWRVDWFGAIERNPSIHTEFLVRVVLSRMRENWKSQDIATDEAVHNESRRSIMIGVGQLPLVWIGSLWREGRRLAISAGTDLNFDLNIGLSTINISKALDLVEGQTLVPFSSHQVSGAGKNALCINVAHKGDPAGIIIPTVEIIRFYFATSSLLSKAVFDGTFTHNINSLIDPEYTGMASGRCVVSRRKEVADNDCWTIGRILNSLEAYEAVRSINDSLIKAQANNQEAFPQAGFPFAGNTTIQARCKQIGWKKKRWLVLSLVSCSGEFPYKELEVIADNDSSKADHQTDIPDDEKLVAFPKSRLKNRNAISSNLILQSEREPGLGAEDYKITLDESRFTAIAGKVILKTKKEKCLYKAGAIKTNINLDFANGLSTANGSYSSIGAIPTRVQVSEERKGLPASWDALIGLLEVLNQYPGVTAKLRQFPWGDGLIEAKLTNRAGRRQWSYLDIESRKIRRFMVADIYYFGKYFTVIEIERRPDSPSDTYLLELLSGTGGGMIGNGELDGLVWQLSVSEGRMKNVQSLPRNIHRLGMGMRHTWKNLVEYADAIISCLELNRTR